MLLRGCVLGCCTIKCTFFVGHAQIHLKSQCEAYDLFINELLCIGKGTIYKSTIVPLQTFCFVSVGQSEAKIEAIMNDFIKLEPQSNVFEAETILKMRKEKRCLSPLLIKVTEMMKMEIKPIQRQNEKLRDHRRRELNLELAKERLKEGNVGAAIDYFQKAVHITPAMAHELIQILRSERVEFIVAPYEADAQLAYLSNLDPEHGDYF